MVKQVFRRFFCLFFALAVFFLRSVPVYASGVTQGASGSGVPVGLELGVDVVSLADMAFKTGVGLGNFCRHFMDNDVCPLCTDLTGQHDFVPKRTLIDGKVGVYYTCRYCGKSAGEVMETAYQEYVDTLPGTRFNSDGAFLWVPQPSDFASSTFYLRANTTAYQSSLSKFSQSFYDSGSVGWTVMPRESIIFSGRKASSYSRIYAQWPSLTVPYTGYYVNVPHPSWLDFGSFVAVGHTISFDTQEYSGSNVVMRARFQSASGNFDVSILWPQFWVTPVSGAPGVGSSFSADTRVSAATNNGGVGLYGYMDNGTLVQSAVNTIFSEGGDVYMNPVTDETKTVTSWDYDYIDRSYTLTTNEGDTVTVTYGDTNVTINEGGETYNVYYLVEHDDSVPCDHTYTSQITQSPACTVGGVKTYTCSICGDTYTEAIAAIGHSYSFSVTQEPTCTASGVRTLTCSACGDVRTEAILATGHSYSSSVTQEPTCTASGVRTSTCSVCGDTRTESIPATGHSYSSSVTMEPTCIGTGVRTFVCAVCGDTYTVSISATGHRWRLIRQEPTVYDEAGQLVTAGYTLYQCDTCGEQYRLAAESGGTALPSPAPDSATTSGDIEIDSGVGRGFLATIAHGLTEDLPEVLHSFSTWFVEFPQFYSGFAMFLKEGIFVCLPDECQRLIGFGFGMVTAVGIVRKIIRR